MTQACLQHVYKDTLIHKAYDPSLGMQSKLGQLEWGELKPVGQDSSQVTNRRDKLAAFMILTSIQHRCTGDWNNMSTTTIDEINTQQWRKFKTSNKKYIIIL